MSSSLLSAIASGQQSLNAIAAAHNIPFPRFTLWLLEPETQEQLAALSAAVASATRLAATSALPEVVNSLKRTLAETSAPEPPQRKTLFPIEANDQDGPNRGQVFRLRRQRVALSASWLLLRLARFTPINTTSQPRPHSPSPKPEAASGEAQRAAGSVSAPAFLNASAFTSDFRHPTSDLDVGAPAFPTGSSSHPLSSPLPSGFRHPASDIDVGAPALSTPSLPASSSDPLAVSGVPAEPADFESAIRCLQQECGLTDEQVAALRADPETWIRERLPDFLDEPALASAHAADDG